MIAGNRAKKIPLLIATLGVSIAFGGCLGTGGHKTAQKNAAGNSLSASAEPDKVLYDRAMDDVKHGRFIEGRLALQTLINTYPDSEYLAKAKLAIGDSYYKEGGTSNLIQAIAEYKDFRTFFPFLDEAAYAQMQIAMAHYEMMEKPDRDKSQAEAAEDEFQAFLLNYPKSPLVPQAEQYLRNVQEVLADSDFRVAQFYYLKQDYPASAARLIELTQRYPLYSQSGEALWMLGDVYSRAQQVSRNEDDKNHWADLAAECYDRLLRDYPLSNQVPEAKARLAEMSMAPPAPDPNALARMEKQQMFEKKHQEIAVMRLPTELFRSRPSVADASRSGQPNLNPPGDVVAASDVLRPGASGPDFSMRGTAGGSTVQSTSSEDNGPVEPVETDGSSGASADGSNATIQMITPSPDTNASPASSSSTPPAAANPSGPKVSMPNLPPPAASNTTPSSSGGNGVAPTSNAGGPAPGNVQAGGGDNVQSIAALKKNEKLNKKAESSSKKKKGLKKLIPW